MGPNPNGSRQTDGKERDEPGQEDRETRPDAADFQSSAESPQLWHITLV